MPNKPTRERCKFWKKPEVADSVCGFLQRDERQLYQDACVAANKAMLRLLRMLSHERRKLWEVERLILPGDPGFRRIMPIILDPVGSYDPQDIQRRSKKDWADFWWQQTKDLEAPAPAPAPQRALDNDESAW